MSSPGFYDYAILFNGTTSSTSYVNSNILNAGKHNKMCIFISQTLGAGLTSAEYKFQQGLLSDQSGEWFDYPIDNIATAAVSTDTPPEFYIEPQAWTQQIKGTPILLGPFEITIGMPFFRVKYKATGAGTLTTKIIATRIIL